MKMQNHKIKGVAILMLTLFMFACNSKNYSIVPDKYLFPELTKLQLSSRISDRDYRDSFFVDEQSFVLQNRNKYYLIILIEPEPLYDRCRPSPSDFVSQGRAVYVRCGTQRINRIVRTYGFEDKEQMEEYASRLYSLI